MKRRSFLTSLSVLAASTVIPNIKSEKISINSTSNADRSIGIYTNKGIERMRIMSSGNVAIGILNPTAKLDIKLNV